MKFDKKKINEGLENLAGKADNIASNISDKTKDIVAKSKDTVTSKLDITGDGKVDIEDIIVLSLKTPGVSISRNEFLSKEFMKKYPNETIEKAISSTPSNAGISIEEVNSIADEVIKFERNCVTSISFALGAPGGAAMAATIPADIIQYYGYMLRAAQKMMYLYGFPEINTEIKGENFDSETLNILIVCLGVMYGVAGANNAIKAMAKALASGVEKKLMKTALTKGAIYPVVKRISREWFNTKITKEIFAGFFKKAIPVVGGVIGGGITYATFKPCCEKLKASLQDTILSNPNHKEINEENIIIDTEYSETI
ncbi:MAG: EcsC family protein [Clostridia bacterium]|nr:EcsC family protein [Clostridia bacterium]